jgi:hypothetical protein
MDIMMLLVVVVSEETLVVLIVVLGRVVESRTLLIPSSTRYFFGLEKAIVTGPDNSDRPRLVSSLRSVSLFGETTE